MRWRKEKERTKGGGGGEQQGITLICQIDRAFFHRERMYAFVIGNIEEVSAPENYFTIRRRSFTGFWSRSALNNTE